MATWAMLLWIGVGCGWSTEEMLWQNIQIDGPRNTVYCIVPQSDGSVLLGTSEGLYHMDENTLSRMGAGEWSIYRINAILPLGERIYLGSNAGLLVYSYADGSVRVVDGSLGEVRSLLWDGETLWIGGTSGAWRVRNTPRTPTPPGPLRKGE